MAGCEDLVEECHGIGMFGVKISNFFLRDVRHDVDSDSHLLLQRLNEIYEIVVNAERRACSLEQRSDCRCLDAKLLANGFVEFGVGLNRAGLVPGVCFCCHDAAHFGYDTRKRLVRPFEYDIAKI